MPLKPEGAAPAMLRLIPFSVMLLLLSACGQVSPTAAPLPTSAATAPVMAAPTSTVDAVPQAAVPPTWTAAPETTETTATPGPTFTPRPTRTLPVFPSDTPRPSPTASNTPTPEATPTASPVPTVNAGVNQLPNASFEGGWYHIGGVPELQVPNRWQLQWETGASGLDQDPAPWVRPESRVLTPDFLPADEYDLFIWDGQQTVKIFKGQGAISFRLTTNVALEPGTYLFEINVFPDLVVEYESDGSKVWAPDPLSGEVRFVVGGQPTEWLLPQFGQKNTFTHAFSLQNAQTLEIGAAMRGRWAIENNGWFMDDWALYRIGE